MDNNCATSSGNEVRQVAVKRRETISACRSHLIVFRDAVHEPMRERVERHDDENLYQPRIHSHWVRELYRLGRQTGLPLTVLVDEALREFVEKCYNGKAMTAERPVPERVPFRKTFEIVGWAYEAGLHCNTCAYDRFKELLTSEETPSDQEGNPLHPLFLGDLTGEEYCSDCGGHLGDQ